jgi:hypothetical protein
MNAVSTPELKGQHQYDFPQKSQPNKFPVDIQNHGLTFDQPTDIKIQHNSENYPTDTPGNSVDTNKGVSFTSFDKAMDSDQLDMDESNKANKSASYVGIESIEDLLRRAK